MKLFESIIDDGTNVFKTLTAVKSKKELLEVYGGNGTFEKITDVTKNYFNCDTEQVLKILNDSLKSCGYGDGETKLICALLEEHLKKSL